MAWQWNGMGAAWAWHATCESALICNDLQHMFCLGIGVSCCLFHKYKEYSLLQILQGIAISNPVELNNFIP